MNENNIEVNFSKKGLIYTFILVLLISFIFFLCNLYDDKRYEVSRYEKYLKLKESVILKDHRKELLSLIEKFDPEKEKFVKDICRFISNVKKEGCNSYNEVYQLIIFYKEKHYIIGSDYCCDKILESFSSTYLKKDVAKIIEKMSKNEKVTDEFIFNTLCKKTGNEYSKRQHVIRVINPVKNAKYPSYLYSSKEYYR